MLKYKAPKIVFTTLLSTLLIQMVPVTAVQFCDDFFIEESYECSTIGLFGRIINNNCDDGDYSVTGSCFI